MPDVVRFPPQVAAFDAMGFAMVAGVCAPAGCDAWSACVPAKAASAGTRSLLGEAWCAEAARRLRTHEVLARLLGPEDVAVQCTYFEKSASRNWLVPMHQDLSIPVAERVPDARLAGWSHKEGAWFVHAPAVLLARLTAVRVHLDACTEADGPLRVVPGSHRLGLMTEEAVNAARRRTAEVVCTGSKGSALVMRPLLLHASSRSSDHSRSRRRVLHFLFGPPALPHGLRWQHAV